MRSRRGGVNFSGKGLMALVLVAAGAAYIYLPMYWDYWAMRKITKDVGEEWRRSKKLQWSKDMLKRAMVEKEVSMDVDDRACDFIERKKSLQIECDWVGKKFIPFIEKTVEKDFSLTVSVESEGAIEVY